MLLMQRAHDAGSLLRERMATPEFALGTSLRRFHDDGIIRVGVVGDAPGFSTRNLDSGRFEGLDVAIARKLVQSIFGGTLIMANNHVEFVELKLAERSSALVEQRVDIVASVFAPTQERRKLVGFTDPYYGAPIGVVTRRESVIQDIVDLKKAAVALVPTTVEAGLFAKDQRAGRVIDCETNDETIAAIISGKADAGAMSSVLFDKYLVTHPELRRLTPVLESFPFAIGVPKGDTDLLSFLNAQVGELVRQGYISLAEAVRQRGLQ